MKLFSCLLFIVLSLSFHSAFSQIKNYEKEWKKIDELIQKKNLPKSALEEVKKIYMLAKKQKQDAQIIKALVYMIGLQQENRDNNQIQAIKEVEKEITISKEPATSILKSLLADLYWQYFQQHRWQLYDRTNTTNFKKDDLATWTTDDFHKKITELYLQSIKNEGLLKQTRLQLYAAIIIKGNVSNLRPTLYDLLANKALDYFKNNERDIKKPAYAFEIDQPEAFAPAQQFVQYKFSTKDSSSLQHKALLIYQQLIAFHLQDIKPDALLDVDINRIEFVYQNSVADNKDSFYRRALENIIQKYSANPAAAQASFLLASYYNQLAVQYDPVKDSTHRFDRIKAKNILEKIVKDSAVKNEGWYNSYNLLNEINRRSFSFEAEKVNIPQQPFRALVKYKNVTALNFRLIKANETLKKELENTNGNEKYWTILLNASPIKSWQQTVPPTNDLQDHGVEIKIDALPRGEYFLVASSDTKFNKTNSVLAAQLIYVSNISYINAGAKYFVLNRESGQPLAKASVDVFWQEYDYKTSRYIKNKQGSYQTDNNGYFTINEKNAKNRYNYSINVSYQNDTLSLNEPAYGYYYDNQNEIEEDQPEKIFFFTDRSIYRPGQTVYFKGIAIIRNKEHSTLATNFKTKIYLEDANGEDVDSVTLTTNSFGSVSGKFQLPQNLLNGEFKIYDEGNNNQITFSVEEYKRPKFYVSFEKVKSSYKVNDTITVTGKANAYAGNNIDGAKVSYRVVRKARFIYAWLSYKYWFPPVSAMEIAHGETTTDKEGKFSVQFTAIPDKKIDPKLDPVFDYQVYADVTDINGETRSGENSITTGYKSLLLQVNLPSRLPVDSLKNIFIRTENMNGEYQPSTVTVSFSKLIPEQRLIRKRYWQQPDQFVFTKEEFIRYFPHDEYRNETDYKTWPKGEVVLSKTDSTKISAQFTVNSMQLTAGYYEITITTKDKDGQEIKDVQFLELFNSKTGAFTKPEYLWTKGSNSIEPGGQTTVQIGSSANQVYLVSEVIKESENKQKEKNNFLFTQLNNEKETFTYTATENDRGGYGVNFFFVKDNRFYQYGDVINVPWTNKNLNIEFETFRNKTLPGSIEKWKVKITGYKNEKVAAEMLASMYDASLDQFKMHTWSKPEIWKSYSMSWPTWNSSQTFTIIYSQQNLVNENYYTHYVKQYDRIIQANKSLFAVNTRMAKLTPGATDSETIKRTVTASVANVTLRGTSSISSENKPLTIVDGVPISSINDINSNDILNISILKGKEAIALYGAEAANGVMFITTKNRAPNTNVEEIKIRKNFNETAFFFPDLITDENGIIEFSFTAPEALTKWKLQTLAHTKELAFGLAQKELITQKELMVQPNAPRFLRQGDHLEFTAKIVNFSNKEITGQAQLELFDETTNQPVDGYFLNTFPNQYFTIAAGQSEAVKFPMQVPFQFNSALRWRVTARTGSLSDGEENILPVLTNKILITETLPLPMRGSGSKTFSFKNLLNSSPAGEGQGNNETLQNRSLTVEFTSNPAWYAVQALPYLMEYPYDCAEQTWNRYYANALAAKIVNASPRIKQIFEQWQSLDTNALLSNLQKNQELKSVLLEETPWVLQAKSETEQKKNMALLFDMVRMSKELKSNLEKLKQMQSSNGGFVWFNGGPDDRYITQYIVTGIGHLKNLGVPTAGLNSILATAIPYLDKKIKEDYDNVVKSKAKLSSQQIGSIQIQYLYMRSFFAAYNIPQASKTAYNFYQKQAEQFWMKQNKYMQGMIALTLHRSGNRQMPAAILKSLKETSLNSEESGMYWKNNNIGYSWQWWFAPIETQALLIEAFNEISKDTKTVNDLQTWLIKNKQTTSWRTTKATADACYALLLQGTDWLTYEPTVQIKLGNTILSNNTQKTEAGTGYFKKIIGANAIKPEMGNITVQVIDANLPAGKVQKEVPSWGAVYWQYFEDMDKVKSAATPLQLVKKLFIEKNNDRGPVLTAIQTGTQLHVGDKIKVRIELRVDRDMEYVHMKDMRASALEPVNVLSGYKWQGGLGYYESTKDASTNFFFNYLRKGTYVFEYALFVTNTGSFSNGITTIQSMYAPEFSAHSEGVRISVE